MIVTDFIMKTLDFVVVPIIIIFIIWLFASELYNKVRDKKWDNNKKETK